jgi:hypothetical protein
MKIINLRYFLQVRVNRLLTNSERMNKTGKQRMLWVRV